MKYPQTNFEVVRSCFYKSYANDDKAKIAVLKENFAGKILPVFHTRLETFQKDFNTWLNQLDIRQAGVLIDILVKDGKSMPKWLANKEYVIDYNDNGMLDIIRLEDRF